MRDNILPQAKIRTEEMIRKRIINLIIIVTTLFIGGLGEMSACTSAIVSASMNPYGRPLLWKHRDTSAIDNKVEYVPSDNGSYSYVALYNADDKKLEEAWMGMNDVGFAVMNTASYNMKDDNVPASKMDREGYVMTIALKSCKTVEDFAKLLDTLPRPRGVEANFGVIDATGNGAFFETNNHSYVRYDLKDAKDGVLVRTNYCHSGKKNKGKGYIREANAEHLLEPYIASKSVTPEALTEDLSRSFYHDKFKKDFSKTGDRWVIDEDFIPRYKSTATIVIEGCLPVENIDDVRPGDLKDEYIMWTGLGYPPCSEIVAVWCTPEGVDPELRGLAAGGHSAMSDRVKQRRADVFPSHKGSNGKYIDMPKLYNDKGTGYVQVLTKKNKETYEVTRRHRDKKAKSQVRP